MLTNEELGHERDRDDMSLTDSEARALRAYADYQDGRTNTVRFDAASTRLLRRGMLGGDYLPTEKGRAALWEYEWCKTQREVESVDVLTREICESILGKDKIAQTLVDALSRGWIEDAPVQLSPEYAALKAQNLELRERLKNATSTIDWADVERRLARALFDDRVAAEVTEVADASIRLGRGHFEFKMDRLREVRDIMWTRTKPLERTDSEQRAALLVAWMRATP